MAKKKTTRKKKDYQAFRIGQMFFVDTIEKYNLDMESQYKYIIGIKDGNDIDHVFPLDDENLLEFIQIICALKETVDSGEKNINEDFFKRLANIKLQQKDELKSKESIYI